MDTTPFSINPGKGICTAARAGSVTVVATPARLPADESSEVADRFGREC
ncbi:hypothetical protein [Prauserella alba]|nr:hypothetical protein [Prauserella alba]MCP2181110.1 hypothetical protein [Prauserella alba]